MPCLKSLIPNLCLGATRSIRDFDLRLGGCGICALEIYCSNFLENKKRLKRPSAWFYDSTYGSGATPYGVRVLRAPYIIKISRLEHLTALKQPELLVGLLDVSEGRTKSNQRDVLTTWSTRRRPAMYSTLAGLGYEELGGLSDPGQRDCL